MEKLHRILLELRRRVKDPEMQLERDILGQV